MSGAPLCTLEHIGRVLARTCERQTGAVRIDMDAQAIRRETGLPTSCLLPCRRRFKQGSAPGHVKERERALCPFGEAGEPMSEWREGQAAAAHAAGRRYRQQEESLPIDAVAEMLRKAAGCVPKEVASC